MTNALLTSAAALTLALAVTSPSFALGGPGAAIMDPERFDLIDTDKDGKLSEAELVADRAARFAQADTNGDGKLTAEEMAALGANGHAKRAGKMISRLDTDGDGALTLAEMSASKRGEKMFARMDADGDGALSKPELEKAREHMRDRAGRGHGAGHGHGEGHGNADQ